MSEQLRAEIIGLIRDLFRDAVLTRSAPDDPSGLYTTYLVDHEQLMRNIESKLESPEAKGDDRE